MCRPDIGYVQGMSYIAGLILLYLDPYHTFLLLTNMISSPSILPIFRMSEEALQTRCQIFRMLLKYNIPQLCDHLDL
jgi:hypothetical protein